MCKVYAHAQPRIYFYPFGVVVPWPMAVCRVAQLFIEPLFSCGLLVYWFVGLWIRGLYFFNLKFVFVSFLAFQRANFPDN
jgi:hypothetical protein